MSIKTVCDICGIEEKDAKNMWEVEINMINMNRACENNLSLKHYCQDHCCIDKFLDAIRKVSD